MLLACFRKRKSACAAAEIPEAHAGHEVAGTHAAHAASGHAGRGHAGGGLLEELLLDDLLFERAAAGSLLLRGGYLCFVQTFDLS